MGTVGLADFDDAGHFYDRGLFLPLCKGSGLGMNCVSASKPFTVLVKHRHLPMMVFSPSVFLERCAFSDFHSEEYITLNILSTNERHATHRQA